MSVDQSMQLLYLVLLGGVIGGYFFLANRHRLGRLVQMGAIWFFIFVGMVLVVGLWDDVTRTAMPRQDVMLVDGATVIEVPRERDGHYHMTLGVNGAPIRFIVDTGATDLVLSREDAARAGLDLDELRYFGRAFTANGEVRTAQVRLDEVRVGEIVDTFVPAVVNEGDMRVSLLGMSYLQEFGRIEIADDTLRLVR
jgi:aspartyl protease family protein